jgi:NitT/TauT family transport system ATP-binding protein
MSPMPPLERAAPLLAFRDVTKRFDAAATALANFDLEVRPGEILSLVGPSGCGKSTALRLAAGLDQPTSGAIRWADDAARRDVGFVFQDPTLMPWATVAANVRLPFRMGRPAPQDVEARVAEALALVGLADAAGRYPRELSGGMRMRASIARALVARPTLLLMDEPFAALDEITRQRLDDELLSLKHRLGLSVVFVTHSVFEAVYVSDRIAVMTPGPGRVLREMTIDAPARDAEFRGSPAYAALCRDASAALAAGMANGATAALEPRL